MGNIVYLLVIFALFAILPAVAVGYALLVKILSAERRIDSLDSRRAQIEVIETEVSSLRRDLETAKARMISLDESLSFLNNKWNARSKSEAQAERRNREKEEKENDEQGAIYENGKPVAVQQAIEFPFPQQKPAVAPRSRRFGEIPKLQKAGG